MSRPIHVSTAADATGVDTVREFGRLVGWFAEPTRHDGGRYTFGPDAPPGESYRLSLVNFGGWQLRWAVFRWED